MEMAVVRCSAHKAMAEAVLCSAALPGAAARAKEGAGEGESGQESVRNGAGARGVIMACSGLALPGGSERRRRAANAADTRRLCPDAGRPPSWAIQFVRQREAEPDDEISS